MYTLEKYFDVNSSKVFVSDKMENPLILFVLCLGIRRIDTHPTGPQPPVGYRVPVWGQGSDVGDLRVQPDSVHL